MVGVLSLATQAFAADGKPIVVNQDGSGDFRTIQTAIDSVPKNSTTRQIISIAAGVYRERLKIGKDVTNLTLRRLGETPAIHIVYDLHAGGTNPVTGEKVGTSGSETVLVEGDGFTAENITFDNDAGAKGPAVAVRTKGDRAIFRNCDFSGWQDRLYTNGKRLYFADCRISGRVDFIFGKATAVFNNCEVISKGGGYVTAASTPATSKYGLVFLGCTLKSENDEKSFLGWPWRPDAQVAYIGCTLGSHIRPEGWDNWRDPNKEKTARYAEYGNKGSDADTSKRVGWAKELTEAEAAEYTIPNILAGEDGWDPTK